MLGIAGDAWVAVKISVAREGEAVVKEAAEVVVEEEVEEEEEKPFLRPSTAVLEADSALDEVSPSSLVEAPQPPLV